jgi:hypothetical protein
MVDINTAFAAIIGVRLKNPSNRVWEITPRNTPTEQEQLNASPNRAYGPYEKEYIHKDGHLVPVTTRGPVDGKKGGKPTLVKRGGCFGKNSRIRKATSQRERSKPCIMPRLEYHDS